MNKNRLQDLLLNMALFESVAEQGSFSATATSLQMTPSSVSKRIAKLEAELGVKLIERTTRTMRLTDTGEQFLRHCQNMLAEANAAVEWVNQSQDELKGNVSIAAPKAFAKLLLEPLILAFLRDYPNINVQVVASDDPVDLLRESIDCSVEVGDTPSAYLIAKPLVPVCQVLCATPNYLDRHLPLHQPADLLNHSCLYLGETTTDNQWQLVKGEQTETVTVRGRYATNHSNMRLQGALQHLGIACLPDFVAKPYLDNGALLAVLPDWQMQSKYHGMTWLTYLPNKFQPLRLRTFIDFLLERI